ncbi:ARR14 [Scenedesmus sp. PABB004]|nr:ARR14 [Scenedesmus sp. PABB004]
MGIKRCPSFSKRPGFPSGLRVLLVDGDSAARSAAEAQLEQCSYSVTPCASTADALSRLTELPGGFDVVLADKALLGCKTRNGQQLLDAAKGLPVILMAADPSPADIMAGIEAGAVDFLAKPLAPLKLANIWQHTVRKLMCNMTIDCPAEAARGAGAGGERPAAARRELEAMCVIPEEEPEGEAAAAAATAAAAAAAARPEAGSASGSPKAAAGAGGGVNTVANVALAVASSFYEPTKSLSRSGSSAVTESSGGARGGAAPKAPRHAPVHSCPSTRSLNSLASSYSTLQLALPEADEEAPAGASPASTPAAAAAQQQQDAARCIKKAVRHPTPATPASKPPLAGGKPAAAAAAAAAAAPAAPAALGPSAGATAAGPLPAPGGAVPLPTGLGALPTGMVWGMPMCPLARAPGIVPPAGAAGAPPAAGGLAGMPSLPGMPWGMFGAPMGLPMPFAPAGFGGAMPAMAMGLPYGAMPAWPGAAAGFDGAAAHDAAAAAAAPVAALPHAGRGGATGASVAAALAASLSLGGGAAPASAPGLDLGDAFDFVLGDITAEDDLDVGMQGLLDGELQLGGLEQELADADAAARLGGPVKAQRVSFDCSSHQQAAARSRASFDCAARSRASFDCSAASAATAGGRMSFDCSAVGGKGHGSARVSFEVSCSNTLRAQAAAASAAKAKAPPPPAKDAAALLGSMGDLFAACSGDSCSEGSAGMTRVDSCGMLADLQSLFGPADGAAGVRDDGCSGAAAAAAAGLFDDDMHDLPLGMALRKSSSLADLLNGGLEPMQA